MDLVLAALGISILANLVMFVPAYKKQTDTLTDISYAATFGIVATLAFALSKGSSLHALVYLAVMFWAYRLGSFLFIRIRRIKIDHRFDKMRSNPSKFIRFWLLQGLTVFVVLINALLFWQTDQTTTNTISIIGLIIFAAGLMLEATADAQKSRFSRNPNNKGKWIETGVWSKTRHPNYLGEMMVWSGLYMATFSSLTAGNRLIGLISPLYIICLLLFASGIPLLEKAADAKWGKDEDYKNYKKRVPKLLPRIF